MGTTKLTPEEGRYADSNTQEKEYSETRGGNRPAPPLLRSRWGREVCFCSKGPQPYRSSAPYWDKTVTEE